VNPQYNKRGSLSAFADFTDPRFFLCNAACDLKLSKVVYITRDPRDVMVSCWHFRKFLDRDFNLSLADFLRSDEHLPCEWDDHLSSWLLPQPTHRNLLVVRYEDMHEDPVAVVRGVLNFAGVRRDEARIDAAIEASRFERMRAAEERCGVNGTNAGDERERAVRRGRVGAWQEEMGYTELRTIEEKYGDVMQQVGYEPLS
jgi:aryl sulfotransferase